MANATRGGVGSLHQNGVGAVSFIVLSMIGDEFCNLRPLACADVCNLPELVGDAAVLFDPHDRLAIAGAVRALWSDPELRDRLGQRGRSRSQSFSWSRTAMVLRATYRRAAGAALTVEDARLLAAAEAA